MVQYPCRGNFMLSEKIVYLCLHSEPWIQILKSLSQSYPDKKTCTKLLTVEVFNKKNIDDKR